MFVASSWGIIYCLLEKESDKKETIWRSRPVDESRPNFR